MAKAQPEDFKAAFDAGTQSSILESLKLLRQAGFYEFLAECEKRYLMESSFDQLPPIELAEQIIEQRRMVNFLHAFKDLENQLKDKEADYVS